MIDWHKLADRALKVAGPIVLAAIAHKVATGKLDVRAVARGAVDPLTAGRVAAIRRDVLGVRS